MSVASVAGKCLAAVEGRSHCCGCRVEARQSQLFVQEASAFTGTYLEESSWQTAEIIPAIPGLKATHPAKLVAGRLFMVYAATQNPVLQSVHEQLDLVVPVLVRRASETLMGQKQLFRGESRSLNPPSLL